MNEKQMQELMQNMDNDLMEKEIDRLISENEIEIDMDAISKKAHNKLKEETDKMKKKKVYPIIAAALIAMVGVSGVYGAEISDFVKSFLNKTQVYSGIVDGEAYYLKSPVTLNDQTSVESVIFAKDKLEMTLDYKLDQDKLPDISLTNEKGDIYVPGGYSASEEGGVQISFFNEVKKDYKFVPTGEVKLAIGEKKYDIVLTAATAVVGNGDIAPSQGTAMDWMNLGYQKTSNGVQIVTSFSDQDLKLSSIGTPAQKEVTHSFENRENGTYSGGSSSVSEPIFGYDGENKAYEFTFNPKDIARPSTQLQSNAPRDKAISLEIPSIVVGYEKEMGNFTVAVPKTGEEKVLNQEIDLKLQKMILKNIKRTSETTAQLTFALNTGENKEVQIRDAGMYSKDLKKGKSTITQNTCIMDVTFDKNLKEIPMEISYPNFVVNGNWNLSLK